MKVKCIRKGKSGWLRVGGIYKVKDDVGKGYLIVRDDGTHYYEKSHFEEIKMAEETKFEVGKKYRGLLNPSCIVKCLFIMPSGAAACSYVIGPSMSIASNDLIISPPSQRYGWVEYKEPRKLEGWVNVWEWTDGFTRFGDRVYLSEKAAINQGYSNGCKLVDTVKIEWIEKV